MIAQLVLLGVSLVAILALAGLAGRLGLGADVRLGGEAQVRELAQAAVFGFEPVELALDRAGIAALLRDADDRIMLIKRHGARFAARLLTSHEGTRLDRNLLEISTGEAMFGKVTLDLGQNSQTWVSRLRRLGGGA